VSTWQALRARNAERKALLARDSAAEQLRQAKRSDARSQAVLKFFQNKVLAAARPKGQEGGVSRDATIREVLDQAEPEIAKAFAGEPLVEASIRNTLGVSYWYLGAQEKALRQQERALALRRRELGSGNAEAVGAMNDVAIILISLGRYREAQSLFEEAVEVKRRTLGPENPNTLRSMNNLATMMAIQGDFENAIKLAQETLDAQRRTEGPETIFTLRSEYNVAIMRRYLGQVDDARRSLEGTLRTLRRVFDPEHQDTLRVMDYLGELLLDQGHPAEARALFEPALQSQRRVLGATSDETILTMINLAETARIQGRLDEARALAEDAVELHRRTLGPEHPQSLVAVMILANVHRDQGRFREARTEYEQAIGGLRRVFSARVPELQRALNAYAWMLATAHDSRYRDGRRAVELANEVVQGVPKSQEIWTTLGAAQYRAGAWQDAIAACEKSEAVSPGRFTAANEMFLAMAHWQLGHKEQGRAWYTKALRSTEKAIQPTERELAMIRLEASHLLEVSDSELSSKGRD
jgi:tetratricopeptide (TPR) repeat protein